MAQQWWTPRSARPADSAMRSSENEEGARIHAASPEFTRRARPAFNALLDICRGTLVGRRLAIHYSPDKKPNLHKNIVPFTGGPLDGNKGSPETSLRLRCSLREGG